MLNVADGDEPKLWSVDDDRGHGCSRRRGTVRRHGAEAQDAAAAGDSCTESGL